MIDAGALFCWFFHYMPVGNNAAVELLPTPEQRETVYRRIREYRSTKAIFSMDFQNDAEYVHGCVAGGQSYLHINAKGDVEPCVFIHYSNCNIHDCTLLDALKSPLFMAYHDNRPFNENMLRPCPMLENPEKLRAMVKATGAVSTDYESPEPVDRLCDKTTPYAERWAPKADALWAAAPHAARAAPGKSADELHRHSELQDIHRRDRGLCAGNAGRPAAHFGHSNGGRVRRQDLSLRRKGKPARRAVLCHAAGGRAGVHVANQPACLPRRV